LEEGLDERGEAPPPYVVGDKPPSIRSTRSEGNGNTERVGCSGREEVELRPWSRNRVERGPPKYGESFRLREGQVERNGNGNGNGDLGLARPRAAVMAAERFVSMRRLMSDTGSSSQA
jgi:hypothetical protein